MMNIEPGQTLEPGTIARQIHAAEQLREQPADEVVDEVGSLLLRTEADDAPIELPESETPELAAADTVLETSVEDDIKIAENREVFKGKLEEIVRPYGELFLAEVPKYDEAVDKHKLKRLFGDDENTKYWAYSAPVVEYDYFNRPLGEKFFYGLTYEVDKEHETTKPIYLDMQVWSRGMLKLRGEKPPNRSIAGREPEMQLGMRYDGVDVKEINTVVNSIPPDNERTASAGSIRDFVDRHNELGSSGYGLGWEVRLSTDEKGEVWLDMLAKDTSYTDTNGNTSVRLSNRSAFASSVSASRYYRYDGASDSFQFVPEYRSGSDDKVTDRLEKKSGKPPVQEIPKEEVLELTRNMLELVPTKHI